MEHLNALLNTLATRLTQNGWLLATAESCTGGGIAAACTDLAGSSIWFECGFVTYSNHAKHTLLGVPTALIDTHGAVSEAVVAAMAHGALQHSQAHVALSVSGIAGPSGGTLHKPVGTVCFGWALPNGTVITQTQHFAGDRAAVRAQSVHYALNTLITLLS